jgi:hypothetical protein
VIGLGGIWAEASTTWPSSPAAGADRVAKAIRSLRGSPALEGGRGRDAVDVDAVAELAAGVGTLLLESGLDLIEPNPVAVHETGCIAPDAIARFRTR